MHRSNIVTIKIFSKKYNLDKDSYFKRMLAGLQQWMLSDTRNIVLNNIINANIINYCLYTGDKYNQYDKLSKHQFVSMHHSLAEG